MTGVLPAVGFCAALLGIGCSLPQVWRLWRSPHADGMSHAAAVIGALATTTWLAYGLLIADRPQILANAPSLVGAVAVLALVLRRSGASARPALAAGAGWAVLVGGVGLIGHAPAVGSAATAATLVARVPQLRRVFAGTSITAVSPASFALTCASSTLWATYGVGTHDAPVWVSSAAVLAISALILARCVRVGGARPSEPGEPPGGWPAATRDAVRAAARGQVAAA